MTAMVFIKLNKLHCIYDLQYKNHKSNLELLIHRDRNHPSVVMWSIANEARSDISNAYWYFGEVASYTKQLDPTRPITAAAAIDHPIVGDGAAPHLDIVSFNRYNVWYIDVGRLDTITTSIMNDARLYYAYFEAFDNLRSEGFFIGEFVWNFADFKTFQSITRVGGNKKGVFTRDRQPKAAAHLFRKRNFQLALEIDNYRNIPADVHEYVTQSKNVFLRNEL